jgi:hypothetical protein
VWIGENMLHVRRKLSQRVPGVTGGWQLVQSDMPEAKELNDVTGLRKVGDVVLMRCSTDFYTAQRRYLEDLTYRRRLGVTEGLHDMAQRYGKYGLQFHTSDDGPNPVMQQAMSRMHARQMAYSKMDNMLRSGTVPGVAPGGDQRR